MRITVFGATGGIGGQIVRQVLASGGSVTAVVRDASRWELSHPELRVVEARDLAVADSLLPALEGSDAAFSGVGARRRKDGPVAQTATRGILEALSRSGARRFLAVSAAPVGPTPAEDTFLTRRVVMPLLGSLFKDVYSDLAAMEDQIAGSGLDWSVIRPPKLTDKPLTGVYRTAIGANVAKGMFISRADVAHAMLAAAGDRKTFGRPIGIAY